MNYNNNRAQGTIEYLVILAVVVVISLIVVGLFTGIFSNSSQQITASSSKLGSVSSGGISIIESVLDSNGDSLIKLNNYSTDSIILTKVTVGGVSNEFSEPVVATDSKTFSLSDLTASCRCISGQKSVSCDYIIEYTQNGIQKVDRLTKTIECVTNATPTNTQTVVGLGSGTLADPWIINSCLELQDMDNHEDGNYALGADIDCSETSTWNQSGSDYNGFSPIGLRDYVEFTGSLDGRGNTISGLYINRPGTDRVGLILQLSRGTVKNLGIVDGYIKGKSYVGSVSGDTVYYARIENVKTNNTVISTNQYVGGITGNHTWGSTIKNSYNEGDVNSISGTKLYVGGIAGFNNASNIINSYNTGNISGTNNMGGITAGEMNHPTYGTATIQNSFSTGQVYGTGVSVKGLVGAVVSGTVTNLWWYDQAGDNATACGTTCSTSTTDSNFYDSTQFVYTQAPIWNDGNWVWSGNSFPNLSWE